MPCTKWDFKVRESTGVTSAIKHFPMAFSTISVGNESHSSGVRVLKGKAGFNAGRDHPG